MQVYILGICGTFMGSLAILARQLGFQVRGCDANVYPPMSTQLEKAGITIDEGFSASHLTAGTPPDLVIVGNALSRGNPMVEYMLDEGLAYTSGPQFLHDYVLKDKQVLAVSGTHGKTTTSAMLAFILEKSGKAPGFLIGGVLEDFPWSARLGEKYFVIEADEYDTAFFDKRSKFVHYSPNVLIINNIEFDHADIFDDLKAIYRQFHHLLRIVPGAGAVIYPAEDNHVANVLAQGCWSKAISISSDGDPVAAVQAVEVRADGTEFTVKQGDQSGRVKWSLLGQHNVANGLAAIVAAMEVGISLADACRSLANFKGVKRRMELMYEGNRMHVYDDFAHHPTAIKTSIEGLKQQTNGRLIAVVELASNTMKEGVHKEALPQAVAAADQCFWYFQGASSWQQSALEDVYDKVDLLVAAILATLKPGDNVLLMSNGSFGGLRQKLKKALEEQDA